MRFTSLLVIAAGLILPTIAQAEPGPGRGACLHDVKTLCAGVQPGGGRIRDCIREHRAQLSQECKMAIAERMSQRGQGRPGHGLDSPKSGAPSRQ